MKQVRKKKVEKSRKVRRDVKVRERGSFEADTKHRKTVVTARRLKPASALALPAVRLEKVVPKNEVIPEKPEVEAETDGKSLERKISIICGKGAWIVGVYETH